MLNPQYLAVSSPEPRVVELVEDDQPLQKALNMALLQQGYEVRLYASREHFELTRRPPGPSVVLLDMRLPGSSGLEIRDGLQRQGSHAPVIFMSGQSSPQEIIDALKGGAHDFLLKPFSVESLLGSVRRAFDHQSEHVEQAERTRRLAAGWAALTRREREVCVLMLKGLANREIAQLHGSVPGTVKVHRGRVLEKMGASTLSDLFRLVGSQNLQHWLDDKDRE